MSDLTTGEGSVPPGWSYPSPLYNHDTQEYESRGMVWVGSEDCTKADIAALKDALGPETKIDIGSLTDEGSFYERNCKVEPYKQVIYL